MFRIVERQIQKSKRGNEGLNMKDRPEAPLAVAETLAKG